VGCSAPACCSKRLDDLQDVLKQRFPKVQAHSMEVQRPKPCADVGIHFVLH
jgi:hypothetical protein